ncbi:MAG: hypothetical protein CVU30_06820 [Betaproteobacteria bacterium HGW-Betaproteobacteria-3]|jgi:hypothetical protein|nr:MAG: hypothetical protein CVU30_06820 [Betaproteobacteria bacterium HGW-Betaproteobacteria-3]
MTPDQLALAQLDLSKLQAWITAIAIFLGPLAGVLFTLWFQRRKDRRDAQQRLFLTLMAHRRSNPPTYDWVNSLNLIDVVFANHRTVVDLWHQYYDLLAQEPVNWHLAESKYLDLLAAMGGVLGYSKLSQTDISKFYSPRAHGNQAQLNIETQTELLRVLKSTERMVVEPRVTDGT